MTRELDTRTLDNAAKRYAGLFMADSGKYDRDWVMQEFYNFTFRDEHEYILEEIRGQLGADAMRDFEERAELVFEPRTDEVFEGLLSKNLAITPAGDHIPGRIGTTAVGGRKIGRRVTRHGVKNATWNVYAGEDAERALGNVRPVGEDGNGADPLPPEDTLFPDETMHMGQGFVMQMALNTNVSIAFAQAGVDAALDLLDEGTVDGVIEGRSNSGAQPVDPDAVITGVLLFSLDLGTPGFGASTDAAPGALGTAAAIADDISADATGTLSHCRASSANVLITPLNDHIDGEAGTSGADFNFNTLAIVAGATVSMTAWTVTQPQGPTAT